MLIVDTSVLISYLQASNNNQSRYLLETESRKIPFAIPNICLQEVLQGARDDKSWKILKNYLSSQIIISPKNLVSSFQEAARIFYDCRKKGLTIRSANDCLIAQMVLENKGVLLHNDKDFVSIAKIRPLKFPDF